MDIETKVTLSSSIIEASGPLALIYPARLSSPSDNVVPPADEASINLTGKQRASPASQAGKMMCRQAMETSGTIGSQPTFRNSA